MAVPYNPYGSYDALNDIYQRKVDEVLRRQQDMASQQMAQMLGMQNQAMGMQSPTSRPIPNPEPNPVLLLLE